MEFPLKNINDNPFGIDFKKELNDEQFEAVTSPLGPALVLAGAGSGKTRTLTYRVAYLLAQNIAPWEILLLTFTNKAAKEMLERVEDLTGMEARKFWGGTFHSISQRILRMHGQALGITPSFNILDASDAESLLAETIKDIDPAFLKDKDHPKAKVIMEVISYSRNTCETIFETIQSCYPYFRYLDEIIPKFYFAYKERKLKQQVLDYDDLLEYLLELLEKEPSIRAAFKEKFKYILVDEYQDTNKLQSRIVDALAQNHQVMAVGDDAQCIYTWRGADFENIMTFETRHPGAIIYKIETNYRSSPEILSFANAVLQNQPSNSGYSKVLRPVKPRGKKPWFVSVMDTRQQAQFILKRIQGLLSEGFQLSDIAILYRAHFHAMDLQMELTRQHIPYEITSGVRFFEQAHIKDLVSQLRFASNELDTVAFSRFACLLPKVGPKTAERILKEALKFSEKNQVSIYKALSEEPVLKKVPEIAREAWVDLAYTMQDVAEGLRSGMTPVEAIKVTVDGWYGDFLRNIYTNWSSRKDDLESLEGFANRFDSMPDLLAQLILLNSETTDRAVKHGDDTLRLTTVHQAKGLEFPVVFVIGLAENLFPLKRAVDEGDVEEERRLFYVASTRAMQELYLSQPKVSMQGGPPTLLNPSRFISEISPDVYETLSFGAPSYL